MTDKKDVSSVVVLVRVSYNKAELNHSTGGVADEATCGSKQDGKDSREIRGIKTVCRASELRHSKLRKTVTLYEPLSMWALLT